MTWRSWLSRLFVKYNFHVLNKPWSLDTQNMFEKIDTSSHIISFKTHLFSVTNIKRYKKGQSWKYHIIPLKRNKQIKSFESVNWRDYFCINTHLDWQYYYQQHGRHQRKFMLLCLLRYFHWGFLLDLLLKARLLYVDVLELIFLNSQ